MSENPSVKKSKLRLEMKSDWHIGTGAGIPGSIDALLARDGDGFPCVPAKTVIGIWRDALETLTLGLDDGPENPKVWRRWVDVIFGSQPNIDKIPTDKPRPSILSIEPARLEENLRVAIGDDKQLRQALTFIKPNTAIDSQSGTAKTESLRFTEMGRIGTILESEFKLDFGVLENASAAQKDLIEALLVASAALVERIGGNRRRGSGKCEMQADGLMSKDDAVKAIRKYQDEPLNIPSWTPRNNSAEAAQSASGSGWKKISYSLKLQTPVAIVTNTLGNVSETLDFIPGTYLLPQVTRQVKSISKYVAGGHFQVSPATVDVQGKRGLPVPKVIHYHKDDGGFDKEKTVYNRLEENIEGGKQKKNYREGYVSTIDGNDVLPFYETTKRILLMHNTVRDDIQRPDETVGGVFSRQAMKAGATFHGEIRLKASIAEELSKQDEDWMKKLNITVRIGTSKKDDYGLAELTVGDLKDDISDPTVSNDKLIVYVESDVLLRNSNLRQTNLVNDLRSFLEKRLSVTLDESETDSLIQVRRIESWHEGWGFPRPTLTAMAAGSVVAFTIDAFDKVTDEQKSALQTTLLDLELSGIGERRGEGYGRIRFNPTLLINPINNWAVPTKAKQNANGSNEALAKLKAEISNAKKLEEFVSIIELAAWRDELARAVLKLASEKEQRKKIFGFDSDEEIPSMSQIGGLRSAIGRLEVPNDKNVIGWLEHLEATPNRLKRWDKNKDQERARKKLKEIKKVISDENKVWEILGQNDSNGRPYFNRLTEFTTSHADIQTKLWAEAVKWLFDACARAHKRDTED